MTSPVLNDGPGRRLVPGFSERTEPFYTLVRLDDRMGTTNHLSDASGNVLASTLETDAFGVETSRTDPSVGPPSRAGFAGSWGYEGEGGGLSLVGNRWYDADAGRFLTRDPARDGSNWWSYCANDPVNAVDPTGETLELIIGVAAWSSISNIQGGNTRKKYNKDLRGLPPNATQKMRDDLQRKWRPKTPRVWRDLLPYRGPDTPKNNVYKSNPKWNKIGSVAGKIGRGTLVLGVAMSAYDIADSEDRSRAIARNAAIWAGAWAGGEAGAYIGSLLFPGVGTIIGGIIGSAVGGYYGGSAGSYYSDRMRSR